MKKCLLVSVLLCSSLLIGCQKQNEVVEQNTTNEVIERPSDNVELPSDRIMQSLKVDEFAEVLVNSSDEQMSITYEIDIEEKTLYLYEDVYSIEEVAEYVLMKPELLSSWNELVVSFKNSTTTFQEILDETVDGWTIIMKFGDKETNTWYVTVRNGEVYDVINDLTFIK